MKKIVIALLTFTAAFFAVSCQKENIKGEGMTICAISEGISSGTKAEMVYKYDVVWNKGDRIRVKNSQKSVEFTLTGGEETTKGIFSSNETISGEVEGFYPSTIVADGGLVWPAEQQCNQICPMYSKKTISSTQGQTFSFASLGSVLQIVFNTTQENIRLEKIQIKDGNATLSGNFEVDEDGIAEITATDKSGITLDLGPTGAALGKGANFFNIAIPAGNYQDLTLTFITTDGTKCVMTGGKLNIKPNTVGKLILTGKTFKSCIPEGAISGKFSVRNGAGQPVRQIYFSQGNLYCSRPSSGSADWTWHFYSEQYGYNSLNAGYEHEFREATDSDTEIDLFTWGYSAAWSTIPTTESYQTDNFTDWGVKIGDGNLWRTLTTEEWQYLFSSDNDTRRNKYKCGVTVCGRTNCVVIAPDNWDLSTNPLQSAYDETSWAQAEAAGAVCLPAAGQRYGSTVGNVGDNGYYCSSSAAIFEDDPSYTGGAYCVIFAKASSYTGIFPFYPDFIGSRYSGYSVRLVTDCL